MKISSYVLLEFLLVTFLFFTSPLSGETEVYFSPDTDILRLFQRQINLSENSLLAAVSSVDLGELVQALVEARKRGVKVRLILDEGYVRENPRIAKFLTEEGLEVRLLGGEAGGQMNNNFAIFDMRTLLTGSYSWTERSQRFNLESVLLIKEPDVVEAYIQEFDHLVGLTRPLVEAPSPKLLPPPKLPPQKEEEGKEFLGISFQELEKIFGEGGQLSDSQKKEAWENYRGKYVQWQGVVVYKGIGRMDWNRVGIRHSQGKEADVEVSFNWNNMGAVLTLREGDFITFTARLSKRKGYGSPYRLDDGELLLDRK